MSTIAVLTSGESGANSLIDINDNFAALNGGKAEISGQVFTGNITAPNFPTAPGISTEYLNGAGAWTTPPGGAVVNTADIWIDGNRVDTYTANGSITYPYKTISAAIAGINSLSYPGYALRITPATYTESGAITFPNKVCIIEGNSSTCIFSAGVTFPNSFDIYDLNIVGSVIQSDTSTTTIHSFQNSSIVSGNISIDGLVLFNGLATAGTGILTVNSGGILNITGSNLASVGAINVSAGGQMEVVGSTIFGHIVNSGTLFFDSSELNITSNAVYALDSSASGSVTYIAGAKIINSGTGGGVNLNNGATSTPNEVNAVDILVGGTTKGLTCGTAVCIVNNYNIIGSSGAFYLTGSAVVSSINPSITFSGTTSGITTLVPNATASGTVTLPAATDTLTGKATTDTFTNKTIIDSTNTVYANAIKSATTAVVVSAATAPSNGQVLTATGSGTANWQTPATGGGTVTSVSVASANGFTGTSSGGTTPALTLATSISGVLKGNGTAISAAVNSDLPSMTATVGGAVPTPPNNTTTFLRGDGTFATPAGSGDMLLAGVQTVTGAKTYNAGKLLDKGEIVFDVKAYGAAGDGTTNDTAACQAAIDAAQAAGGGVVWFPHGTYKLVTSPLQLYTGTTPTITAYQNITLAGAGSSGTGGSIIIQTTTGVDCIKGLNDVANGAQSISCVIKDLCVSWGTGTLTNSGNGIYLAQQSAGGPSFQQFKILNVIAQNFQGSGKYGFNFESLITSNLDTSMAVTCANGFYLNGQAGGAYNSVNTSVVMTNCYANGNVANGYNIQDSTYCTLVGCACDYNANTSGTGYLVGGSSSIAFVACGCELDGTHTLTNMWKIGADTASNGSSQVGLYNCYGFQPKTCVVVYVTGASTGVSIIGFQVNSNISGTTGLKIDSGSQVVDQNSDFSTASTALTNAGTYSNLADASGVIQGAGYKSADGTVGLTQASTTTVGKSITVKNGLIVAFA